MASPVLEFPPLSVRAQLRWDVVAPVLERLRPRTTIEVGVGSGAMSTRVAAMTSDSYLGIELDAGAFARAKPRIERFGGQARQEPLAEVAPEAAELFVAFEVLEHIRDDEAALREWVSFTEPGGHVLLSVPVDQSRFGAMDEHAGHYRRYEVDGLRSLASSCGLEVETVQRYGGPLGYVLEGVRNRIDARKLAALRSGGDAPSPETLTAATGRTFQFADHGLTSAAATAATLPFRRMQRRWPGAVGVVLLARRIG